MDKPARSKISIFSFLPKATSFSFSNYPFSPSHDKRQENLSKFKANAGRGFSGPIVSIIPAEARSKTKNGSFDGQEPTSPKVSCIGQIKQKKKNCKPKCNSPPPKQSDHKKLQFKIGRIFHGARRASKPDVEDTPAPAPAPSLGQLRRFTSGRSVLADFDWKAPGGAVSSHRGYYSDEERDGRDHDDDGDDEDDDDDFAVPHSAPLVVGGGVALGPRNEMNIWKRRTMDPPRSLQLKVKRHG
ncbi:hypothetical protein CKAN_02159400 [Cinnamomum micranthum f. kanehirae]|uniref:Syringolide-induced protein 14-1-1 n=1 Tax=Cinnamomum micranthum f. kanehirae TaxID=337451 RepID=A0A3S3NHJ1_9MAGN|nr:hypothetical protein CKAN_02159200 [Cinnamomum micranthum f. kanehirae]RWR92384.1 hypothetical protein CKAN_02159400 [Cinnamomum micranthum f. kanehirae]